MLDIKFIRENKDLIKEAGRKKKIDFNIDELITVDDERKELQRAFDEKRAEQNRTSGLITSTQDESEKIRYVEEMKVVKVNMQEAEEKLKSTMQKWHSLMLQVPNIPDFSVPEGKGEEDNVEEKTWGEKPEFAFPLKDHIELMNSLEMVDFERGTKIHGFRGYLLKNDGANISWALWNYARDFFGKRGFMHFVAPTIVRKEFFYGTGHLPNDAEDIYKTQDDDYLSGTAEIPMMAYHSEETLRKEELPKKYLAFSPCYRREAGSHGKDTKGLIRVHEFYKLEQLVLCEADHTMSAKFFEELNKNFEDFLESLELPYRRLLTCTGDLSASKVKQFDTEVWIPSQNAYREVSSVSYFHDFQTRRFNIKYDDGEKKRYVHSLNSTAVATPRIIASIVENYQREDGSVAVPEVLVPFMGKEAIGKPSMQ